MMIVCVSECAKVTFLNFWSHESPIIPHWIWSSFESSVLGKFTFYMN